MGVRNARKQELARLSSKTFKAQLLSVLQVGLGCSPFEANGVVEAVEEVYRPLVAAAPQALPGRLTLVAVCADEPAGKPLDACLKRTVALEVHRGAVDDRVLHNQGPTAFRRSRLTDVCQQALAQGALLTREDLAWRVFFVSPRTISRDLAHLRACRPKVPVPMRGMVHDMGPVLSHRVKIVRMALRGATMTQICKATHHSPAAVANYLSTFARCAALALRQIACEEIAFVVGRGPQLVACYLQLLDECHADAHMCWHLERMIDAGGGVPADGQVRPAGGKKGGTGHGA
jgi:hypothetical protein